VLCILEKVSPGISRVKIRFEMRCLTSFVFLLIGLRSIPPGFTRGLFGTGVEDEEDEDEEEDELHDAATGMKPAPVYRPAGVAGPSTSQVSACQTVEE